MQDRKTYDDIYFDVLFDKLDKEDGKQDYDWLLDQPPESGPDTSKIEKFQKCIEKARKKNRNRKSRQKQVLAASIILAFVFSATAYAFRFPIYQIFRAIQQRYSMLQVTVDESPFVGVKCSPTYIPDGYVLSESPDTVLTHQLIYLSEQEDELIFCQYSKGNTVNNDSEEAEVIKPITVNGNQGIYIEKEGVHNLSWIDGESIFGIIGNINFAEMLKMAESVQPVIN